jgi:MFS family permease
MQIEATPAAAISPANRAPILALLSANAISLVGSTLTMIALPWFVLQTTGSAAMTGLAGFFTFLPAFIAGIFGGALVDRFGYKRISIVADLISGVGIALIPLLHQTVGLAFWQLLALVFLGGLLTIPGLTARRSLLPELAGLARVRLERVNGSFEAIQHLAFLCGPPLAGLLILWLGASNVLWIDAATFAASALIVALAMPAMRANAPTAQSSRYRDALVAGLHFLRRDRLLLSLAVCLAISNFLSNPLLAVILPVYVKTTFGRATDLGLMVAAEGGGMLVGALLFSAIGHRLPRRAVWIGAFMIFPVDLWVLALAPPLPVILAVLVISGVISGPINPLLVTIRHERIPIQLRGRVFSTFSAISQVASPLGILVAGGLIEAIGLHTTVLALAVCAQIVGLATLFVPAFHDMDAPATHAGHEPAVLEGA